MGWIEPFKNIERMLEECARGYTLRIATHSRVISFNKKTYIKFPKHDEIEFCHIRKLVRYLEIPLDCARKHFPDL